jgi:hypothetical protein
MAANTGLDFARGAIPLLGDLFDVYFKANKRNIALLQAELSRGGLRRDVRRKG